MRAVICYQLDLCKKSKAFNREDAKGAKSLIYLALRSLRLCG